MTDHDGHHDANGSAKPHRPHPALIATAVALPVALIVGIVVAAVIVSTASEPQADAGPVAVSGSVPAPDGDSPACAGLLSALPESMGDYSRAELAEPAPEGAAAWRLDADTQNERAGDVPVILRCGVNRPPEFRQGKPMQQVDDVQWFHVTDREVGEALSTWYAVDRPVYIALTLPGTSGSGPIQELSKTIAQTMPAQDIDPAPYQAPDGG